ncbi:MAG: 2OG-Fe(II) oxygenase [Pararhodobacter sp.]
MAKYHNRLPGDPLPHVAQRTLGKERFNLGAAAGRYLVLCLYGHDDSPGAQEALAFAQARGDLFDDRFASCFMVSADPGAADAPPLRERPGLRLFLDEDAHVSCAYGSTAFEGPASAPFRPLWVIADPMLRVIETRPLVPGSAAAIGTLLENLEPPERFAGFALQAPILFLPRVFEPDLCAELIARYEAHGGEVSGFMRAVDGKTVGMHDPGFKSRRDHIITDQGLIRTLQDRILRRVVPEIAKAHAFHVTRMERYIVSCYRADEGGHFAPHRDNTTPGTAHRRFAISINLNDDFDGGEVSFPEYGPQGFKAPKGGAVVFGCSLLHAVSRVTRGARYAFLPFVYDDAAAEIRARNLHTVQDGNA